MTKNPILQPCADLAHDVAAEVEKAYAGQQSDEDALIAIDEVVAKATGHDAADGGPPTPEILARARATRFAPPEGGPDGEDVERLRSQGRSPHVI